MSEPFAPTIGVSSDPDAQPSQSVGIAVLVLVEKECIEQLFSLRIERFAPCL